MRKLSKRILAVALACSLSLSAAVCVAAEEVQLPDPVLLLDMENATDNGYKVVEEGSAAPEIVDDYDTETGTGMGNVLKVPASSAAGDTEIQFTNPFAGMDLSEGTQTEDVRGALDGDHYVAEIDGMPIWYEGVVLNYWIKTTDETNSVIFNFRNEDRRQYHKDDWRKHILAVEAQKAYDEAKANNTPINPLFELGEVKIYKDDNGTEYNVYSGGGTYMNYNPDYENGYVLGGGTAAIEVYPADADPAMSENRVTIVTAGEDNHKRYYELDYEKNPDSFGRYGYPDGHLQISVDGSVSFLEDDGSGTNLNPNVSPERPNEFNHRNKLQWFGSEFMKDLIVNTADTSEWHMVTVVIQNDWIQFYVDGEEYSDQMYEFTYFGSVLNGDAGGKSFNAGFGLRGNLQKGAMSRGDFTNGNRAGLLLTEWLSLDDTTFSIGGTNDFLLSTGYKERVAEFLIDDVAFYAEMLDENQIIALYEQGLEKLEKGGSEGLCGDVNSDGRVDAKDALLVLQHAAKITTVDTANADTNNDAKYDAKDALNILKYAAKIIDTLPVTE